MSYQRNKHRCRIKEKVTKECANAAYQESIERIQQDGGSYNNSIIEIQMSTWYRKSKRREDNIAGHKYGGKTELACVNGNITAIIHNDTLLKRQCRNPGGSANIPAFSKEARVVFLWMKAAFLRYISRRKNIITDWQESSMVAK